MRAYTKPEIVFEDFSLSTNIAAGCEFQTNSTSMTCGVDVGASMGIPNMIVFSSQNTGCIFTQGVTGEENGEPEYNGICYHNPSSTSNVFSSL